MDQEESMAFLLFFEALHYVTTTVGMVLNFFLMYLIAARTPSYIRTYSILIFNFAITDLLVCASDMFTQVRVVPCGFSVAYLFVGPCKVFGSYPCYLGYSTMMHLYAHSLYSLLLTFTYRYYILKYRTPKPYQLLICIAIAYALPLFQFVTFNMASATEEEAIEILSRWNYNLTDFGVSANSYIFEWKTAFTMFHMTLPVTPCYIAILWLRRNTIRLLKDHSYMSTDVKLMHSLLLKALSFQACLPCLYSIGVISYALGQAGIFNHPALEYLTFMSFVFLPVLSPLCSIYFVKPYRCAVMNSSPWKSRIYTRDDMLSRTA